MKKWIQNFLLLFASLLISFLIAELTTRLIFPISPGPKTFSLDGKPIAGPLAPGLQYRQVTTEYDVLTTITDQGYRVPTARGNPDIIFIGDSFTFGVGLRDEDTFVYQYCNALELSCVNLGASNTGTIEQLNRLEKFLTTQNWKPKEVKLFILAMTSFLSYGNDLTDNLNYKMKLKKENTNSNVGGSDFLPGLLEKIITRRNNLLRYSNLFRVIYFYFGEKLQTIIYPKSNRNRINVALEITRQQLIRLKNLSDSFGFDYEIFLLHPIQDITKKTYKKTLKALERISPVPIQETAYLFEDDPSKYYYAFDSHLNVRGSRKIAEFLLSRDPRYKQRSM